MKISVFLPGDGKLIFWSSFIVLHYKPFYIWNSLSLSLSLSQYLLGVLWRLVMKFCNDHCGKVFVSLFIIYLSCCGFCRSYANGMIENSVNLVKQVYKKVCLMDLEVGYMLKRILCTMQQSCLIKWLKEIVCCEKSWLIGTLFSLVRVSYICMN